MTSTVDVECDEYVGGLGLMSRKLGHICIAPVGDIDHLCRLDIPAGLDRFDDVETVVIDEKRVITEQVVQFRDDGVIFGNGLGANLVQGLLDLDRRQFHGAVLFAVAQDLSFQVANFQFSARLQAFTEVPGWASARLLPEQRRRQPLLIGRPLDVGDAATPLRGGVSMKPTQDNENRSYNCCGQLSENGRCVKF
jgi:hypothetical protein